MVLINKDKGVLNKSKELTESKSFEYTQVAKPACIADILRIHDYRYISRVIKICENLQNGLYDQETLVRYDRDTILSAESWNAALLATGAVIEACDKVMTDQYRNAFCAIRPPGHHAGVFGKTFKDNVCD